MKVYISGPVTGTDDYVERFQKAEDELYGQGFIPVNPAAVNAMLPEETAYEEYMKVSLVLLDMCDAIYLLEGWQDSRGANREYGYALAKDYIILRADPHPTERKYAAPCPELAAGEPEYVRQVGTGVHMKRIRLFPSPHVEVRIFVTEEMEKDYKECREMSETLGDGKDCDTCSWNKVELMDIGLCGLELNDALD